ncbi:glycosyltransferase family 4 protein [Maribacter sp.]|uniref:glycosyltransferase family 4 protein n=1 Tax=Maribacter sp. TaxID=1897614 RepID=UPI0025C6F01C|nr:glycosyltransferase family 4 protein [Maribacter sp.]
MKILWVTNSIFPELAEKIGTPTPTSGGWMFNLAKQLANLKNIELIIATVSDISNTIHENINGITYYIIPTKKGRMNYDVSLENKWKELIDKEKPDLTHIHGTEYAHGIALMNACPNLKSVVSIQGMISVISRYYAGGISKKNITKKISLRDVLLRQSFFSGEKMLRSRANSEINSLQKAQHVIGRTDWDKAHAITINPNVTYHFCNETLRENFYKTKPWNIASCETNSIFLSQANYPLKGAHQVIKALPYILKKHPKTKIKIAGTSTPFNSGKSLISRLKETGYSKYLKYLIHKNNLKNNIHFLGPLNEVQMIKEYQSSHVFVCPSSIENSPNSLGEAQLLGVPCVGSYVGGIPNMIKHKINGLLYRYEEIEMLAENIISIFANDQYATEISKKGLMTAEERHNPQGNLTQLIKIYDTIIAS